MKFSSLFKFLTNLSIFVYIFQITHDIPKSIFNVIQRSSYGQLLIFEKIHYSNHLFGMGSDFVHIVKNAYANHLNWCHRGPPDFAIHWGWEGHTDFINLWNTHYKKNNWKSSNTAIHVARTCVCSGLKTNKRGGLPIF